MRCSPQKGKGCEFGKFFSVQDITTYHHRDEYSTVSTWISNLKLRFRRKKDRKIFRIIYGRSGNIVMSDRNMLQPKFDSKKPFCLKFLFLLFLKFHSSKKSPHPQISLIYSLIVRSLEKYPRRAVLNSAFCAQTRGCLYKRSHSCCSSQ